MSKKDERETYIGLLKTDGRTREVKYKGIIHERVEDAPFTGALIVAPDCYMGCKGCFNQHLIDQEPLWDTPQEIITQVLINPFNEGIILAGLEWSYDPYAMNSLIEMALKCGLKVMVYTGLTEDAFFERVTKWIVNNCYVKFGAYDETQLDDNYYSFGVKLASRNQYIKSFRRSDEN